MRAQKGSKDPYWCKRNLKKIKNIGFGLSIQFLGSEVVNRWFVFHPYVFLFELVMFLNLTCSCWLSGRFRLGIYCYLFGFWDSHLVE